jgi:hypothetical protein
LFKRNINKNAGGKMGNYFGILILLRLGEGRKKWDFLS